MNIDDFIQQEQRRIQYFKLSWLLNNKEQGDDAFPMDMEPHKWVEQYNIWDGE